MFYRLNTLRLCTLLLHAISCSICANAYILQDPTPGNAAVFFDMLVAGTEKQCAPLQAGGRLNGLNISFDFTNPHDSYVYDLFITVTIISNGLPGNCLQFGGFDHEEPGCPSEGWFPESWLVPDSGYYHYYADIADANYISTDRNIWWVCVGNGYIDSQKIRYNGTLSLLDLGTTPAPSSAPTITPTMSFGQHIYVQAVDLHGDGWRDDIYLSVTYDNSTSEYYSLHCACKVIRLASLNGDMTLSMHRNASAAKAPFEWEVLWTIGYSDGVSSMSFDVFGDMNTVISVNNWTISSISNNINTKDPKIKCSHPPPPKPSPSKNTTLHDKLDDPLVSVRLVLIENEAKAWCDDSEETHEIICSKEQGISADAVLPNVLTYPRYYISDAEGRVLMQFGTMAQDEERFNTEVRLPRDGSFIFSVSGHYLSENGTLSWEFCGEQGGISERLHFNMLHGVCKPHYIEVLNNELTCEGEWSSGMLLSAPIASIAASQELSLVRYGIRIGTVFIGLLAAIALLLVARKRSRADSAGVEFMRLDSTERATTTRE